MSAELTTSDYTPDQARQFTDEIKLDGQALWRKVAEAYEGRIWIALGYPAGQGGWQAYIADEFPDGLLSPPKDRQADAIQHYLSHGMSTRAIAQVTDLSKNTVARRAKEIQQEVCASGVPFGTPANVQGMDGKTYAPHQSQRPKVEAEIVFDDEADSQNGVPNSAGPVPRPAPSPLTESARAEALDRPASDLGLEPFEVSAGQGGSDHLVTAEMVQESLAELIHSPRRGFPSARNRASEIEHVLALGVWTPDGKAAIENSLGEVADQTADTTRMLTRLLIELAEDRHTEGKAMAALGTGSVANPVTEALRNLRRVSEITNNT